MEPINGLTDCYDQLALPGLPPEATEKVISYLSLLNMQETVNVSKSWNIALISKAGRSEFLAVKSFINWLTPHLSTEVKALSITYIKKFKKTANLIQLKFLTHQLNEDFLELFPIKNCFFFQDYPLKNEEPLYFFENIFIASKLCVKAHQIKAKPINADPRGEILQIFIGVFEDLIAEAEDVESRMCKTIKKLADLGFCAKAREVADLFFIGKQAEVYAYIDQVDQRKKNYKDLFRAEIDGGVVSLH